MFALNPVKLRLIFIMVNLLVKTLLSFTYININITICTCNDTMLGIVDMQMIDWLVGMIRILSPSDMNIPNNYLDRGHTTGQRTGGAVMPCYSLDNVTDMVLAVEMFGA